MPAFLAVKLSKDSCFFFLFFRETNLLLEDSLEPLHGLLCKQENNPFQTQVLVDVDPKLQVKSASSLISVYSISTCLNKSVFCAEGHNK